MIGKKGPKHNAITTQMYKTMTKNQKIRHYTTHPELIWYGMRYGNPIVYLMLIEDDLEPWTAHHDSSWLWSRICTPKLTKEIARQRDVIWHPNGTLKDGK